MTIGTRFSFVAILALVLFLPIGTSAQTTATQNDSLWQTFAFMEGNWKGEGGGDPGQGTYERSYSFIFSKKYLEVKNKSVYKPSAENPQGEVHEDLGYISYDKLRKRFVLRQFHIEGFVNQYTLDSLSADGRHIVFTSEAIENIRPGWRAQEAYDILNEDTFRETFQLAAPGKDFEPYSTVVLHRIK